MEDFTKQDEAYRAYQKGFADGVKSVTDNNVGDKSTREKLIELLTHDDCPIFMVFGDNMEGLAAYLIANGVRLKKKQATSDESKRWIPVSERLPEPETEVLVLAERKSYSFKTKSVATYHIVTTAMYEDGSKNTEDSGWLWETDGFEYDEELDAYIIPEGWWEYKHYNGDDEHNHAIDDVVTHWMPLPEAPKGE